MNGDLAIAAQATGVGVGFTEIRATFADLDLVGRFDISVRMT